MKLGVSFGRQWQGVSAAAVEGSNVQKKRQGAAAAAEMVIDTKLSVSDGLLTDQDFQVQMIEFFHNFVCAENRSSL